MQKEQLLELRRKILESTQEVALRGEGSPAETLQVLLSIVRSGDASVEVLMKVYELAMLSENDSDKLTALLDVLYEVDAKLSAEDEADTHSKEASQGAQQKPQDDENSQDQGGYEQQHDTQENYDHQGDEHHQG